LPVLAHEELPDGRSHVTFQSLELGGNPSIRKYAVCVLVNRFVTLVRPEVVYAVAVTT
jgi:hypothetical protein